MQFNMEFPEFPHFYNFLHMHENAEIHMQYFQKPYLICLVEYSKNFLKSAANGMNSTLPRI